MNAAEQLKWMRRAIFNDDDGNYDEFRREVEELDAQAGGYPDRIADEIESTYNEMRGGM